MNIVHIKNGVLTLESFADNIEIDFEHIAVDIVPEEPIESWYIEDGEIKIDQQKLLEFNRAQMPALTPIQFDIKLNNAGLYDAVQALIKDNFELRIAYTRATFFSRTDPFIDQARIALNLTDEQVDAMWVGQGTTHQKITIKLIQGV